MKVKIHKNEDDLIMDYFRLKDIHSFRLGALRHICANNDENAVIYADTNSRQKAMPISEIENCMRDCGIPYVIEPVESSKRGIFGLGSFLSSSGKNKKLPENMIVAEIKKDTPLEELYEGFLMNYDYAVGWGSDIDIKEIMLRIKSDPFGVLFNKKVFTNTFYDSVVARRFRMDAPYEIFDDFKVD